MQSTSSGRWPSAVLDVQVSGEIVRILAVKGSDADELTARAGTISVPFEFESDEAALEGFSIDLLRLALRGAPAVFSPAPGSHSTGLKRLGVNLDPSWTLPNDDVSFVQITTGAAGLEFDLTGPRIDVTPGCHYVASCRGAAHRAEGELVVTFLNAQGAAVGRAAAGFGPQFQGGSDINKYKHVVVRATAPATAASARLTIRLIETVNAVEGHDSYLFWARPEFIEDEPALAGKPGVAGAHDSIRAKTDVLTASFAGFAIGHIHDELVLESGDQQYQVLPGWQQGDLGAMSEVDGNVVYIDAPRKTNVRLYVEGAAVCDGIHEPAARRIKFTLPVFLLDGQAHLLEVRDVTGFRIYRSDAQLLPMARTPYDVIQRYTSAPHPFHLSNAAAFRYRSLVKHLEHADEHDISDLHRLHGVLVLGFESIKKFEPLAFPLRESPDVSVVIPAHNKFNVTYYCLCALLFAFNEASFEVILVDDGSSDETSNVEAIVSGITVVRNDQAQGFVGACNAGAARARGRYIVFLNNDTEPTLHWLDELLKVFAANPKAGLAGSRLLYPDGRQQEAGGIVWGSGNPWNYGRNANPWEPRFSYLRQADYLSGAALMVPAHVWTEVGGFSEEMRPAYFEDTDLAFKVRAKGYRTFYVPHSIVYHFEGISSGTDTASGLKRFQEVNRPKFKRKWAEAFRGHGKEGVNPDLEKDRGILGRVLFIDHQMPRPDYDAGSYAAIQEMRLVQSLGLKASFIPENMAYLGHYADDLQRLGIETIYAPFVNSVEEYLSAHGGEFDAIYLTRYQVARKFIDMIRRLAPQAKIIFNNADLHFLREIRSALHRRNQEELATAMATRDAELEVMRKVDLTLSYNDAEHAVILSHNFDASKVAKCPWVVEPVARVRDFAEREGIAFLGGFAHPPNSEAVEYFVADIMPDLRKALPGIRFHIYGAQMPEKITQLAADDIVIEGQVETVATVYDRHRVFVAPLVSGAGIKGKVIGAMGHGIPTVLSQIAAEGTGMRNGHDCLIADTPRDWVRAIASLYKDGDLWRKISSNGYELVREDFSFDKGRKLMAKAFETVGIYGTVAEERAA